MGDFLEESNQKEIEKLMKLSASNICTYKIVGTPKRRTSNKSSEFSQCIRVQPNTFLKVKTIFIVFTINIECCWQSSNFDLDFFLFKFQLLIRILTQNFDPAAPSILYN